MKIFAFKLHSAAKGNILASACCIVVTGSVPFLDLLFFCKFASSFVSLNSFGVIWRFTLALVIYAKMKRQIFSNLKTPVCHYFIILFQQIMKLTISCDKLAVCATPITGRMERNKPSGCNFNQKFKCVLVLVVRLCSSLSRQRFWSFNKHHCAICGYTTFP